MKQMFEWHQINRGSDEITEYMLIPEGKLYRTTSWTGDSGSFAVAMVFVAGK